MRHRLIAACARRSARCDNQQPATNAENVRRTDERAFEAEDSCSTKPDSNVSRLGSMGRRMALLSAAAGLPLLASCGCDDQVGPHV